MYKVQQYAERLGTNCNILHVEHIEYKGRIDASKIES